MFGWLKKKGFWVGLLNVGVNAGIETVTSGKPITKGNAGVNVGKSVIGEIDRARREKELQDEARRLREVE